VSSLEDTTRIAFEGVAPGKYLVEVVDTARRIWEEQEVELTGEDTIDLVFDSESIVKVLRHLGLP